MSFNYLVDTLDGTVGYEINSSDLSISNLYNGRIKNNVNLNSDLKTVSHVEQRTKCNSQETFISTNTAEVNLEERKLRFSEKLKTLLKNGGSKIEKIEQIDPYAFNEIDPQYGGSFTKALSKMGSSIQDTTVNSTKINCGTLQKSIKFTKLTTPKPLFNNYTSKEDCNNLVTNDFDKGIKLKKFGVPMLPASNSVISKLNQSPYKLNTTEQPEKLISNLKNGRALPIQLLSNNKPPVNKTNQQPTLQNSKPPNLNNKFKTYKSASGGKAFSFGPSQNHKQSNLKIEKKTENKQKTYPKGKSLLNQIQKTALLNRSNGHSSRKSSSKGLFFGMSKNSQKDLSFKSDSFNKNIKKSLLEESLLGLKSHANSKNFISGNSLVSHPNEQSYTKSGCVKSPVETASATILTPLKSRTDFLDQGKHESLERIWNIRNKLKGLKRDHHHFGLTINDAEYDENSNSESLLFQNYWFSVCNDYDSVSNNDRRRDTKLSQLKVELRHKIKQLQWRYQDEYRDKVVELLVDSARKQPNLTAFLIRLENSKFNNRKKISRIQPFNLLKPLLCTYTYPESGKKCRGQAMPCVKYCQQHITYSNEQLLFTGCTALQSDNSTCQAAVLDLNTENPLCFLHKRLEVNQALMSDIPKDMFSVKSVKPAQPRKRSRSSTGNSRTSKSRKRKKSTQKDRKSESIDSIRVSQSANNSLSSHGKSSDDTNDTFKKRNALSEINPQVVSKCEADESQEVEVGEEVLAIAADLPLELATQATKLLEEHDFTNVLNHIPPDAFNDLFTEDKEEYEPTPQETEELERALEAVDKDVKSLEKLSQTQGILDTLLDEQTIAQTLAQLPEVTTNLEVPQTLVPVFYHNGFSSISQIEQTLHDVNKSLTQTVLLNQGTEAISNHFVNSLSIPNHTDVLQS